LKSLLKVLAVAGVMAVSLVAVEKDALAEPVVSSWYGPGFEGAPTASGVPFDPWAMTAAHPYLPFGTQLQVCYLDCAVVTVNDRGPFVHGRGLDLSQGAAQAVGLSGVDVVDVQVLGSGYYAQPY
jgi:rare lipoprotein A